MTEDFSNLIDNDDDTYQVISMTDENNDTSDYFVLDAIKLDTIQYLLVVSSDNYDDDEVEAFIIKEISQDGRDSIYEPVTDDDEYNKVVILLQDEDKDYEMQF